MSSLIYICVKHLTKVYVYILIRLEDRVVFKSIYTQSEDFGDYLIHTCTMGR